MLRVEIDRLIEQWAALWLSYQRSIERAKEQHHRGRPDWPDPADSDTAPAGRAFG
jgi:hypothetical protein